MMDEHFIEYMTRVVLFVHNIVFAHNTPRIEKALLKEDGIRDCLRECFLGQVMSKMLVNFYKASIQKNFCKVLSKSNSVESNIKALYEIICDLYASSMNNKKLALE